MPQCKFIGYNENDILELSQCVHWCRSVLAYGSYCVILLCLAGSQHFVARQPLCDMWYTSYPYDCFSAPTPYVCQLKP